MEPSRGVRRSDVAAERVPVAGVALHVPLVQSREAFIDAVLTAVRAPAWAGRNWDAVEELLTDLTWLPAGPVTLVWAHPLALADSDPRAYRTAIDVLTRAAAGGRERPVAVVLADQD